MEQMQSMDQFKGQNRLPKFAVPKLYDLHLKLDLVSCKFSGVLQISISIVEETRFLVLNSLELGIDQVHFSSNSAHQIFPSEVVSDDEDEILVLRFDGVLPIGEGVLGIQFSGVLNDQLKGLYRCTYMDGEEEKNMATTQFEAVDARRCFPCWDEPALKANFKITLDVPVELTALSNMPVIEEKIDGNVKTVYFEESPLMSTYLVAVVVGSFDHIEDTTADGTKVCVYCPPGQSDNGKFALEIAVKSLELFSKYFSVPYPLPKLDMVAVPEFSGGAMENNGLIIYRENELLYDEMLSTAARKQRITIVVTHEVAHHWFGNLVTMEWWTHLWLNEGFATWVSYMATDWLFPEWKIWNQFLDHGTSGLQKDALKKSHPIEVEIPHARSVLEVFDEISYNKGSAVIKMLQHYLGDQTFQKALSSYVQKYSWKNAKTEDLWNVLTEESGVRVDEMMTSWTKQKGYPVISVKLNGRHLEFEQTQFQSSGSHGEGQWLVPITLCVGSYQRLKKFLLDTKSGGIDISDLLSSIEENFGLLKGKDQEKLDEKTWIKVNVDQSGFYRVKYEDKLAARLGAAIRTDSLSAADKYGILDDTYALCEACDQSLSSFLSLMDGYRKEIDYTVLAKLIDVCYSITEICYDAVPDSVHNLKQFFINLLQFSAERLGWESVPGESHLTLLSRGQVLTALAKLGDERTHKEAITRFESLVKDPNTTLLSADTKRAAYIAVMRNTTISNRNHFESLLRFYREANTVQEKEHILRLIAGSPDQKIVLEVLNFLVSDEVRVSDIIYGLAGLSLEGRDTAWEWLKENWDLIVKKYGTGVLFPNFIKSIVMAFSSDEKADEAEEFFSSRVTNEFSMNLEQGIERVRVKARWIQHIKQEKSLEHLINHLACSKGRSTSSLIQ